ncbi:MAG: DUF2934 domain-containing protein [Phycisphaerales bacterium]|nr:DUF2934 domain-containing protein [Phycisphaerales bacterium]
MAQHSAAMAGPSARAGVGPRGTRKSTKRPAERRGSVLLEPLPSILPAAQTEAKPSANEPTELEIRERAYQIYLQRGCAPGHHLDDWVQAERELRARAA